MEMNKITAMLDMLREKKHKWTKIITDTPEM